MTNHDEEFDALLQVTLRDAVNAEPRTGLERRILANVRTAPARRLWWYPAIAVPLAAVAVLAVAHHHRAPAPQLQAKIVRSEAPPQLPVQTEAAKPSPRPAARHHVSAPVVQPALQTADTDDDTTVLIALAEQHPERVRDLLETRKTASEAKIRPVHFAAIHVVGDAPTEF